VPWRERLTDAVRAHRGDPRIGVVALVLVAVAAGVVWYRIGADGGGSAEAPVRASRAAPVSSRPPFTSPTATVGTRGAAAGSVVVHVAGAVAHPGVVTLHAGARVVDALDAVGGALPEADLDRLDLAAKVTDGERVFVAKVGQADPGVLGDDGAATGAAPGAKVNLNTATAAQLETLPGIGPTYAQAIIAERQRRGGFRSTSELRAVRGIGDSRFAQLADLVTV